MRQLSPFRRAVWIFVALPVCILLIGPSDLLSPHWWRVQAASEIAGVMVSALVGLLLGIFAAWDIWYTVSRRPANWQVALVLGFILAAIVLRQLGIWRWTFVQSDALITVLCLTMTIATAITEHRRNVRVYVSAHEYVFIPGTRDA